jgi:Rrf2 family transcriptional regulator, nitric oxide-sensitive transcriptional repressor
MRLMVFTDYALRVLMVLAHRPDQLVTIGEIAKTFDISEPHLMKVTHLLGKTPWVETLRGRGGGMRLVANAKELRLGDVIQLLEADFALAECFQAEDHCRLSAGCGLAPMLSGALNAFFAKLNQYTLADAVQTSPALQTLPWPTAMSAAQQKSTSVSPP